MITKSIVEIKKLNYYQWAIYRTFQDSMTSFLPLLLLDLLLFYARACPNEIQYLT